MYVFIAGEQKGRDRGTVPASFRPRPKCSCGSQPSSHNVL